MKRQISVVILLLVMMLLAGCGGDSDETSSSNDSSANPVSSADLALADGQFYTISASGAINDSFSSEFWGEQSTQRRLFLNDIVSPAYWTLLLGGSNSVDATTISLIQLGILEGIEPGTYPLLGGGMLDTPEADEPVKVININVRYPDFDIINDDEQIDGTITIDTISDDGMSGTMDMTLSGEGGEVQVAVRFDVPVTGPLEEE